MKLALLFSAILGGVIANNFEGKYVVPESEADIHIQANIIGGSPSSKLYYPYITQLYQYDEERKKYYFTCTASLINEQYVVTAAHCVHDEEDNEIPGKTIFLNIGQDKLAVNSDIKNFYKVTEVILNDYTDLIKNDIALLKLDRKVPASVATPAKVYPYKVNSNTPLEVAGFGVTNYFAKFVSSTLQKTRVSASTGLKCRMFNPFWFNNSGSSICSINESENDACQGDSGGPLVAKLNGKRTLVGITSWGMNVNLSKLNQCGNNTVSFYTRSAYYVKWMASKIGVDYTDMIEIYKK
ncbi:Urokinase-type plasminogen activator [Smittium culicis]|uniref:Urokinase-type plasminogen activator n=1 Tax=Smittium culicis TaxID=133412 RepID=A0A1R1XLX3_9FUNG|nr:Urokinase-type plasminogen activator [Smittium culicis]